MLCVASVGLFPQGLYLAIVPIVHSLFDLLAAYHILLVVVVAIVQNIVAAEDTFELLFVADDQRPHILVDFP